MDSLNSELQILVSQLGMDLELSNNSAINSAGFLEQLKIQLADKILDLLKNDHTRLFNILYRIDVKEEFVNEALKTTFLNEAADNLAELIIQRQIQKIQSRQNYSRQKSNDQDNN